MTLTPRQALSTFYFIWFCTVAVNIAFAPIHCRLLGFTPYEIALVVISANIALLFAPPVTLWLAHHVISPRNLIFVLCSLPLMAFYLLRESTSLLSVFISWLVITFGGSGATALVETHTMRLADSGDLRFETVRIWGSVGFLLASIATGILFDIFRLNGIFSAGIIFCLLLIFTPLLLRPFLLDKPEKHDHKNGDRPTDNGKVTEFVTQKPELILLLVVSALQWASHSSLYVYFSLYLQDRGWSGAGISAAWNIGVISEIVLFLKFTELQKKFTLIQILRFSIVAAVIRWSVLFAWPSTSGIIFAQLLHAFSFAAFFLSSLKILYLLTPAHYRSRVQGILAAFGPGLGSIAGRIGIGTVAELLPHPVNLRLLFIPAGLMAAVALLFTIPLGSRIKNLVISEKDDNSSTLPSDL